MSKYDLPCVRCEKLINEKSAFCPWCGCEQPIAMRWLLTRARSVENRLAKVAAGRELTKKEATEKALAEQARSWLAGHLVAMPPPGGAGLHPADGSV